jgi:hypothetical protein
VDEKRTRKPVRRDKDGNEILAYEPRVVDVIRLTRSDLESRARTAGHWGIPEARAVVAREAMAWAHDVLREGE